MDHKELEILLKDVVKNSIIKMEDLLFTIMIIYFLNLRLKNPII